MQFTHHVSVTVDAAAEEIWNDWCNIHRLPHLLSHVRATATGEEVDLARLVIALDGRHLEFAAQQTMCESETVCWQNLGPDFIYVLTVQIAPFRAGQVQVTVTVAYDPPGFLPDIAESLGRSKLFRAALENDLKNYAQKAARLGDPAECVLSH